MKKLMIFMVAAVAALSLAACAPTKVDVKQVETTAVEMPEEVTTGGAFDKVPDPNAPAAEAVIIYSLGSDGKLSSTLDEVKELNAQSLIDKLAEFNVIEKSVEVKSFDMTGEAAGPGASTAESAQGKTGTLELAEEPKAGTAGGDQMMAAISDTFIENFELDEFHVIVNGKEVQ